MKQPTLPDVLPDIRRNFHIYLLDLLSYQGHNVGKGESGIYLFQWIATIDLNHTYVTYAGWSSHNRLGIYLTNARLLLLCP